MGVRLVLWDLGEEWGVEGLAREPTGISRVKGTLMSETSVTRGYRIGSQRTSVRTELAM